MMHRRINRKLIATLLFSLLSACGLIIHGMFFDVDFTQLKRLTLEGFILTFIIVFPTMLLLEWIFDLENRAEFKMLENKIKKLEQKRK